MAWSHHVQHPWADRLPRKDAICHAARARCLDRVHPNRAPAFNPPHKAGKLGSTFCSEKEGIRTSRGLFTTLSICFLRTRAGRMLAWSNLGRLGCTSSFDTRENVAPKLHHLNLPA